MDNAKLDALVYPSWDYPPRLILLTAGRQCELKLGGLPVPLPSWAVP